MLTEVILFPREQLNSLKKNGTNSASSFVFILFSKFGELAIKKYSEILLFSCWLIWHLFTSNTGCVSPEKHS